MPHGGKQKVSLFSTCRRLELIKFKPAEFPDGTVPLRAYTAYADKNYEKRNLFDFDESPVDTPLSSSPSTSDEELYSRAQALQDPINPTPSPQPSARRPPPPPPSGRGVHE